VEQLWPDRAEIERTVCPNVNELDDLDAYVKAGATHFILGMGAPWDMEPLKKLVAWRDAQG